VPGQVGSCVTTAAAPAASPGALLAGIALLIATAFLALRLRREH
jgi:LPXTG-motif cell wall-anchored protein